MIRQIEIEKLECERLEKKIEEHIQQKVSDSKKKDNLPQVDKIHKEIIFTECEAQIKQAEKEAAKTSKISSEIIESMCE